MRRARLCGRLLRLAAVIGAGLALAAFLALRYRDPLAGIHRRRQLTRWWLTRLGRALPLRVEVIGTMPDAPMLWVGNHLSWSDIPLLGQLTPLGFLSKSEVRQWPLIGWLAAQAGTLFIRRGGGDSSRVNHLLAEELRQGRSVLLFPEGTTTAGDQVGPFHPRLFASAIEAGVAVQPVALRYWRDGRRDPVAPFIDDDTLPAHLLRLLSADQATVEIQLLAPITSHGLDRRALAQRAQRAIAEALFPTPAACLEQAA